MLSSARRGAPGSPAFGPVDAYRQDRKSLDFCAEWRWRRPGQVANFPPVLERIPLELIAPPTGWTQAESIAGLDPECHCQEIGFLLGYCEFL